MRELRDLLPTSIMLKVPKVTERDAMLGSSKVYHDYMSCLAYLPGKRLEKRTVHGCG